MPMTAISVMDFFLIPMICQLAQEPMVKKKDFRLTYFVEGHALYFWKIRQNIRLTQIGGCTRKSCNFCG